MAHRAIVFRAIETTTWSLAFLVGEWNMSPAVLGLKELRCRITIPASPASYLGISKSTICWGEEQRAPGGIPSADDPPSINRLDRYCPSWSPVNAADQGLIPNVRLWGTFLCAVAGGANDDSQG